jgi:hypothetical protein
MTTLKKIEKIDESDDVYSPSDDTWYPSTNIVMTLIVKVNELIDQHNALIGELSRSTYTKVKEEDL